jgi:hypothetical protein
VCTKRKKRKQKGTLKNQLNPDRKSLSVARTPYENFCNKKPKSKVITPATPFKTSQQI